VYVRDSGIVHALLGLRSRDQIFGWPNCGGSWEGFVLDQLLSHQNGWKPSYYRDSGGSEIDLILERGMQKVAIECKLSSAPKVERGFWSAREIVKPDYTWIIAPVADAYPYKDGVEVIPVREAMNRLNILSE